MKQVAFVVLGLLSISASAIEKPAALDPKVPCVIDYPKMSLLNEEKGTVTMSLMISAEGKVLESKLVKSCGFKKLDNAAINGILKCKFQSSSSGRHDMEYVWKLD